MFFAHILNVLFSGLMEVEALCLGINFEAYNKKNEIKKEKPNTTTKINFKTNALLSKMC